MDPIVAAVLEAIEQESYRVSVLRVPDEILVTFEWYSAGFSHDAAAYRIVAFIYHRPGKKDKMIPCTRRVRVAA